MNKRKLFEKIMRGSKNVQFSDMTLPVEAFGFRLSRIRGSHYIFVHPEIPELVNLQVVQGDISDLKFCSAFGETPEEALREVLIAKQAWLDTAHDEGKPIPLPHYKPAIYQEAS